MSEMSLPPLGSTVTIVKIGLPIWPEAEQFIGANCTLCAVFDTDGTLMVAVEHQEEGICCCFQARMVRTPEQMQAEARQVGVDDLAHEIAGYMGRDDPYDIDNRLAAYLYDQRFRRLPPQ
ncbi:hypothetical protein [Pseudomonas sp. PS01300]|uniref:hypothetical protein n=1 Tax=Pseudomonas sp. PS01300 TaxID=2991436 RepID=UPI00249AA4D3|nr:hypothetical protein [Pseudomonas sp. PS01300]